MTEAIRKLQGDNLVSTKTIVDKGATLESKPIFQSMLDEAYQYLEQVSQMENNVSALTEGHLRGEVSMERVMIETNKLSLAVQLASSIVNKTVTSFKEVERIQV